MVTSKDKSEIISWLVKAVGAAFIVGGAWYRLEYKMDEASEKLLKRIDEHILADKFEKQILQSQITELSKTIANMQDEAKEYFKTEFVRPEDIRRKKYR